MRTARMEGSGRWAGDLRALRRRLAALDRLIEAMRAYVAAGGSLPVPTVCVVWCRLRRRAA
jgi:hypothetical protein